ncbi:uncharacterized protein M421DRAFT_426076, partial [Didymella exigua CBS 183.55]
MTGILDALAEINNLKLGNKLVTYSITKLVISPNQSKSAKTNTTLHFTLSVSENGWTNNALSLEWLKHFNAHTRARQVGGYRLLILDSHKSHLNQDFKDYCLDNKILTLS